MGLIPLIIKEKSKGVNNKKMGDLSISPPNVTDNHDAGGFLLMR